MRASEGDRAWVVRTSPHDIQSYDGAKSPTYNAPKVRFSATLGKEPEVGWVRLGPAIGDQLIMDLPREREVSHAGVVDVPDLPPPENL